MVKTAKLNRVNPYYYLQYVLENVSPLPDPKKLTTSDLDKLMHWNNDLKEADKAFRKKKED